MESEYLVAYGLNGDFGRFRAAGPLNCQRGDWVVIRTTRGVELGQVLRAASPGHAHFLPNTSVGPLLRRASEIDVRSAESHHDRGGAFCAAAARRAQTLELPVAVLDAEFLLDEQAVLHFVRWQECDLRPLVSGLASEFDLKVLLQDLTRSATAEEEHSCGSCGSGGCGSCGSGGCGSCGEEKSPSSFAGLREQMEAPPRVSLI